MAGSGGKGTFKVLTLGLFLFFSLGSTWSPTAFIVDDGETPRWAELGGSRLLPRQAWSSFSIPSVLIRLAARWPLPCWCGARMTVFPWSSPRTSLDIAPRCRPGPGSAFRFCPKMGGRSCLVETLPQNRLIRKDKIL